MVRMALTTLSALETLLGRVRTRVHVTEVTGRQEGHVCPQHRPQHQTVQQVKVKVHHPPGGRDSACTEGR